MRVLALSLCFAVSIEAQFTQQGSRLIGVDGTAPNLGTSVAISADGQTAAAGGPNDQGQAGGVWIFTRNGEVWSQQGERLRGSGSVVNEARQGHSVAISADGNTVLIGAPRERPDGPFVGTYAGAAWVFTRDAGVWSQQGTKLTGTGAFGNAEQGTSVGLSADGNTAIVGGPSDNGSAGAAWIFTRSGDTWTQEAKLVGFTITGSAGRGSAVALSGDGNTAIVGGPSGLDGGAAWIFVRSEGSWSQEAQFLPFGSVSAFPRFGAAVALSYDGNTALVGLPHESSESGAAWVYVRGGVEWEQQGPALAGSTENPGGRQGTSVSLSADGNTAVIGGPTDHPEGAAWVFTRDEDVWTQQGSKLVGTGALTQFGTPSQGRSVAISADANTIVEGGSTDGSRGSVWPFAKAVPTIATSSGDLQSAQINGAFQPLTVIVRDAADQPSSNASVTFTISAGASGASGTFASSATVLTNESGIATAPVLTANGTIGGFTVTATTTAAPSAATFNLANAALPAPANLTATPTPNPTVVLNWTASPGATLYEIVRGSGNIIYTSHATTSSTSFVDSVQVIANSRYFYTVRAIEPALSGFSAPAFTVVKNFTDPSLAAGTTIKGVHFTELRHAVHNVRAAAGLDDYAYTDPHLTGDPIKVVHLTELRAALDEALARMMLPPVLYTRPTITAGSTAVAAVDVLELRNGVQ
jgi:hypothetical protein